MVIKTPPTDAVEAKRALEKARRDLTAQQAMWPRVNRAARLLGDALEDNHFGERIWRALEARDDR
jgi:hypothetical protein